MKISINVVTVPEALPVGIIEGLLRIGYGTQDSSGVISSSDHQDVSVDGAIFEASLSEGEYVAFAQRLDSDGGNLGNEIKATFTVSAPKFNAPTSIEVTLA